MLYMERGNVYNRQYKRIRNIIFGKTNTQYRKGEL